MPSKRGAGLAVGPRAVRYLAPSAISADPDARVVLFKSSLNTGWDCPRAEVMLSYRSATDRTHIAQLVGRMVRTPLARHIGLVAAVEVEHRRLEKTADFETKVAAARTLDVRAVSLRLDTGEETEESGSYAVSVENLQDLFDKSGRRLGEGLHRSTGDGWSLRAVTPRPACGRRSRSRSSPVTPPPVTGSSPSRVPLPTSG